MKFNNFEMRSGRAKRLFFLLRNPWVFLFAFKFIIKKNFLNIKDEEKDERKVTFLVGFNDWKTFLHEWFPERKLVFLPMKVSLPEFIGALGWKRIYKKTSRFFNGGSRLMKM